MLIEESWVDNHRRVLKIDFGGKRVYSIDFYCKPVKCGDVQVIIENGPVKLASVDLGGRCSAILLITPEGAEAISLRLVTSAVDDPAGGDPLRAREICLEAWGRSSCQDSARC